MNKVLLVVMMTLGVVIVSTPAMARRGADDPAGHVRGADHADGHVSGRDRVREVRVKEDRVRAVEDRGGDRVRVGGGGRNDRTGDAPRVNGEDGGPRQCRGCDPASGPNRDRSVPSTND
jgi:hypothetical protein